MAQDKAALEAVATLLPRWLLFLVSFVCSRDKLVSQAIVLQHQSIPVNFVFVVETKFVDTEAWWSLSLKALLTVPHAERF